MLINRTAHNNGIYRRSFHFVRANISKKLHSISENANKHLCMIQETIIYSNVLFLDEYYLKITNILKM